MPKLIGEFNYILELEITPFAYKKLDDIAQKKRITPDLLIQKIIIDYLNSE